MSHLPTAFYGRRKINEREKSSGFERKQKTNGSFSQTKVYRSCEGVDYILELNFMFASTAVHAVATILW